MKNKKAVSTTIINIVVITIIIAIIGVAILNKPSTTPATINELQTSNSTETQNNTITPPTIKPLSQNLSCKEMYDEIEQDMDNSNYCETDTDCDFILLGDNYVKFGCYHYINKNVNEELIFQKMNIYNKNRCSSIINRCAPTPKAQCVTKKCIAIKK